MNFGLAERFGYWHRPSKYQEERQRVEKNLQTLRAVLDREQRKVLLRILDDEELIASKATSEAFAKGFQMAVWIMIESLYLCEPTPDPMA